MFKRKKQQLKGFCFPTLADWPPLMQRPGTLTINRAAVRARDGGCRDRSPLMSAFSAPGASRNQFLRDSVTNIRAGVLLAGLLFLSIDALVFLTSEHFKVLLKKNSGERKIKSP